MLCWSITSSHRSLRSRLTTLAMRFKNRRAELAPAKRNPRKFVPGQSITFRELPLDIVLEILKHLDGHSLAIFMLVAKFVTGDLLNKQNLASLRREYKRQLIKDETFLREGYGIEVYRAQQKLP